MNRFIAANQARRIFFSLLIGTTMASKTPRFTRTRSHCGAKLFGRVIPAVLLAAALAAAPIAPAAAETAGSASDREDAAMAAVVADPQLSVPGFDSDAFQNPTDQKPAVLWFWDRPQTEAQIDARLESIHDAGFQETVIFRWFGDVPEAFFSQSWFDRVEHLLSKSRELGMTVWLDNDDKFPSGSAGGFIVNGGTVGDKTYGPRPDLRVKTLATGGSAIRHGGTDIELQSLFGSSLQLDNGQVVADTNSAPGITLLNDGAEWSNYTAAATFSIVRDTAGFMVRSSDTNNGYLVDVRSDGKIDVWNQQNGVFRPLRIGSTTRPGWSPTASHDIQITLDGPSIGITLDGVAEPALQSASHSTGTVGMRVAGNQAWRLDSLAVTELPGGAALYSNDYSDDTSVSDFDVKTEVLENVVAVAARPATEPGLTDPNQVIDVTSDYLVDGVWTAPAGDWRIEAYRYVLRGGDRAAYADTMDVEAQRLYTQIIFDEYYERFSKYFGTTLLGFADDEPEVGRHGDDRPPWTPALAARFQDAGLNTAAVITSVFNDLGPAGSTLRAKYYQTMSDQWVDAYWKTKYQWAEEHGVSVLSNPLYDEYGPAGRLHESGNLLTMHQWAQIPGTDLIGNQVENGMVRNLPYEPASIAHQLGRPLVYDELMGATGWQKSLADVRKGAAMSAVRGINKALYHATFDANKTAAFPPTFSDSNVWWKFMPQVNDWTGRLMEFGRHTTAAQTAVVQMQRAAEAAQRGDESAVDGPFFNTEHSLEDAQVDFDLLDEGALSGDPAILAPAMVTSDGRLDVGEMSYSAVVVPHAPLVSLEAIQTLVAFVEAGGKLVFAGGAPTAEISGRNAELAESLAALADAGGDRVVSTPDAAGAGSAAASLGQAAVTLETPSQTVRALRFQEGSTSGYLLLNEGIAPVTTTVTFPAAGVPVKWDPDTGTVAEFTAYNTGELTTAVPMTLQPNVPVGVTVSPELDASAHVVQVTGPGTVEAVSVAKGSATVAVRSSEAGRTDVRATDGTSTYTGTVTTPTLPAAIDLSGDWAMALGNGSAAVTRPLSNWTDLAPGYSGTAVYTRNADLTAEQVAAGWELDLGRVANTAEVTVNGVAVGNRIAVPYTVDIGAELVAGSNTIEVTVTNTDGNAHGVNAESGLLGPVALTPYAITESALARSTVQVRTATASMDASGEFARVDLTVENPTDTAITGTPNITGPGWGAGAAAQVTIPAHGTVVVSSTSVPTGFIPNGIVLLSAGFVVDGVTADTRQVALDASFATPPTGFSDHVDFGDAASEDAHNVVGSLTSGTSTEAGLTRRYAGYRVADAWYQTELSVAAGTPLWLQATETYDANPQQKSYRIFVNDTLVDTRLNVRDLREEGTAAYRLLIPASVVTSDTVTVRFQSLSNPDFADPSLADVWAVPLVGDTVAPLVQATVDSASPGDNGWMRGPARVSVSATDDRPGALAVEYNAGTGWAGYTGPVTIDAEGTTEVAFRATDATGNTSETGTVTVSIDSVAPTATAEIVGAYAPGVAIAPGTVNLAAVDEDSGVAGIRHRVDGGEWADGDTANLPNAGEYTVSYTASDLAGNVSDVGELQVTVLADVPAGPLVSATISHAGSGGWHLAGAAVELTATEGSSPVESIEFALDGGEWTGYTTPIVLPEGPSMVRYRATDAAGIVSPVGERSIKVDGTDPTSWGWLGRSGQLHTAVQDERSGAATGQYSLDGESWTTGLDTLVAVNPAPSELWFRAADVAGNVGAELHLAAAKAPEQLSVVPGTKIVLEAYRFVAGQTVRFELHSDPVLLGTAVASSLGVAALSTVMPASTEAGAHTLVIVAEMPGGPGDGGVIIPVDVLPLTGFSPLAPAGIAALLLLAGAAVAVMRRHRRAVLE